MKVVSSGCLDRIYGAMRAFPTSATVQQYACWALANISADAEVKLKVVATGGVELLYATMSALTDNAEVQVSFRIE